MSPEFRFASVVKDLFPNTTAGQWYFEVTRDGGFRASHALITGFCKVTPDGVWFETRAVARHRVLGQVATWDQIEAYCRSLQENITGPNQQCLQEAVKALRAAGLNEIASLVASAPEGRAASLAQEVSQLVSPSG